MLSKNVKDVETNSIPPLLRPLHRSRESSVASFSSVNQIDKDTLSQALDQIHTAASQTGHLTTFNEYTPPPPSSQETTDVKKASSDGQGSISILYNRLRASVGNTKDSVSTDDEKASSEKSSLKDQAGSKPKPATGREKNEGQVPYPAPQHGSAQESVSGGTDHHTEHADTKAALSSEESKNVREQSRSGLGAKLPLSSSKAPLQRAGQMISETDAAKNQKPLNEQIKAVPALRSSLVDRGSSTKPSSRKDGNDIKGGDRTTPSLRLSSPSSSAKSGEKIKKSIVSPTSVKSTEASLGSEEAVLEKGTDAEMVTSRKTTDAEAASVIRDSALEDQNIRDTERGSEMLSTASLNDMSTKEDDPQLPTNTRPPKAVGWKPPAQHLEIPSRKTLAPPIVSKNEYPSGPPLSRASSIESNTDSLVSNTRSFMQAPSKSTMRSGTSTPRHMDPSLIVSNQRALRKVNVVSQVKNKILNKDYWMKDENARDCFMCGGPFSTFRRKHHCRICGQIFDAKCTVIIKGEHFGQQGNLRVCISCEGVINGNEDSSDFSDEESLAMPTFRPRHGSTAGSDIFPSPFLGGSPTHLERFRKNTSHPDLSVPTMSIPSARKAGEKASRKSTVLDIGGSHGLARPSSSRSLKSAFTGKPFSSGHRRHNSRHQIQRSFKALREDEAPFHQEDIDVKPDSGRLPAFHDDNVIDPDLAPYLSDEASSGDEQMNIMAALNEDNLSRSQDYERPNLATFAASSRRARSKLGEKSLSAVTFASRDNDAHSIHSIKMSNPAKSAKRRNMSFSGGLFTRPSLRSRANLTPLGYGPSIIENVSATNLTQINQPSSALSTRMVRSSSMKGDAAPAIELNDASLYHVRRLLRQLLEDSRISNVSSWEKALVPILLRATDDVNPDIQNGDDMDIRHYVKLKKIPGGRPGDTSYVSGLVFTKNLALKSMPREISNPNILILTFPLEYARYQQHFMSLEPVIRQEREFLQNLVNRIAALRPQLLLVERHVAGLALEFLQRANIATAYNVKPSVLEAVSRCCQTRIISSIDKLAISPAQVGKCADFYVKTFFNRGRKKTHMFLSGCAKELGCTIVLRGDKEHVLAKMKRITEFMIYVVYNLKLETSLMSDEFAAIPSAAEIGSAQVKADNRYPSVSSHSTHIEKRSMVGENSEQELSLKTSSKTGQDSAQTNEEGQQRLADQSSESQDTQPRPQIDLPQEDSVPDDIPMPTFYSDMVEKHTTKILSASPFVKFAQPYLLMRAREQERRLAYLKRLCDQDELDEQKGEEKPKVEKFDLIKPEMVHEIIPNASRKVREVLHAVHDAEYDKALHIYQTQVKQWETYIAGSLDLFDPYAHQNIAVLYSVVCTTTTVPCSGPDLLALDFYNEHETEDDFEADCTLGQYVEDLCFGASTVCTSNGCEKQMLDHHRQYVHAQGQLTVFVEQHPCRINGLQDNILMWSVCKICGAETRTLGMSENTWKYSFGKYLELSFWSSDLHAAAGICPHDLHRDHLRYFGYRDLALRIHYDPITLLEIIVPRTRITWKVDNDLRFKNDLFTKIEDRLNKFMFSVKARIKSINTQSVLPDKIEACKEEIERLTKKATDEHHQLVQKLRKRYMNSKHYEIIPLNRAIRATQEKVVEWVTLFTDFDRNFFPSEKDIRRLATLQLRSIFLENDHSRKDRPTSEDGIITPASQDLLSEKLSEGELKSLSPQTRDMSLQSANDMLASVVEKHTVTEGSPTENEETAVNVVNPKTADPQTMVGDENVRHLDLAVPANPRSTVSTEGEGVIDAAVTDLPRPDLPEVRVDAPTEPSNKSEESREENRSVAQQSSGIPRPSELQKRDTSLNASLSTSRTQSQPGHNREKDLDGETLNYTLPQLDKSRIPKSTFGATGASSATVETPDKKFSDRLGLAGAVAHSMIPRSITRKKNSKVSSLAKHFEQLSREFERERMKERRNWAAEHRRSKAFPMTASKPIVQVYRNFHEAVEEKEPSVEELISSDPSLHSQEETTHTTQAMAANQVSETKGEGFHAEDTVAEKKDDDVHTIDESHAGTDLEADQESDEDYPVFDDLQIPGLSDEDQALTAEEAQLDLKLDLPKHEKTSLMKMLSNFWAERSASGWQPLEYPLSATDHIFADSDIIVREDEPSSLIALSLSSEDYQSKLSHFSDQTRASANKDSDPEMAQLLEDLDGQANCEHSLLRPTGTHLKYQFSESSAKMLCKVFYAEQFDALRRKCGVADRFVESLSRCMKWDSKGGKTKSVFLKTLDDRFVLKSLSPIETQAFLRFAPAYFRIMSESLFHDLPSVIAKMLGFYQVIIKNPVTGVEFNWFLLVMENLFYDRSPTRIFDLKGSMRNRRIQSTGEQNEVLLDENMVEFIYESPLFAREHSKKLLRASVWNDTLFLSRQNVMDYSLMIAIDENRKELVVGIIDCIRTYTWDKKLESWIKDRGKNRPTVTSPKEYKSRFREAMGRYVLQAPNCWHQFKPQLTETRPLRMDDPGDDKETQVVGI